MLTWPHADTDWSPHLHDIYPVFAAIGSAIAAGELLLSVCRSATHAATIRQWLLRSGASAGRLRFCIADSNDTWARDHGPITTLIDNTPLLNDFGFNGWGGKFDAELDAAITGRLQSAGVFADAEVRQRPLVLEGGALESDGLGTLLATRSSVVTPTRNPGHSTRDIEGLLGAWLGIDRFLWLDHGGLSGDDTDGHIDTLARFVDPQTIVYTTAPPGDPDYDELMAMAEQLHGLRDRAGNPYRLLPLPFPGIHRAADGRRLPATYANFLILNHAVLLPIYGVDQDGQAIDSLQAVFPDRRIVPIDCRAIIEQNGSLHCLTMQLPAPLALRSSQEFTAV